MEGGRVVRATQLPSIPIAFQRWMEPWNGGSIHLGNCHGQNIYAPLLLFILFEMGLCRFSPLIDRLLAMPMREVGMVRRCLVSASFKCLAASLRQ
jgi:hypothetical protein